MLVVDDDTRLVQVVEMYLQNHGFDVVAASGGVAALEALQAVRPDAIILDLMMPGINGIEVCRRLRADDAWRDIPVLVLTAFPGSETAAMEAGANRFVAKPFSLDDLAGEVGELITRTMKTSEVNEDD